MPPPRLGARLDRELAVVNLEYRAKRESGRLGPVEVAHVEVGWSVQLRRERSLASATAADAQFKVAHLQSALPRSPSD
jgi:hypothetical protein